MATSLKNISLSTIGYSSDCRGDESKHDKPSNPPLWLWSSLTAKIQKELTTYSREILSGENLIKACVSAGVGCVLGIMTSLIVNCTLVEVSLSPFFATYFGLLFLSIGAVILWRINSTASDNASLRKMQLTFFAILILISGVMCFVLEQNWFVGLSPIPKIPIYTLLGVSMAFALTFSLVDVVNYGIGLLQHSLARPLVDSRNQVFLILCFSVIKGAVFGFIFGVMDIEDVASYHIRLAVLKEEHFCYPFGAILGAMAGLGIEYMRQREQLETMKGYGEFDDEI